MTIDFPIDKTSTEAGLTYRPWGTRTLKVKVSTGTRTPVLRLRPHGIRAEEVEQGIFRAYADDSDAFIISWGGGHELGPCLQAQDFLVAFEKCVPLQPGTTSMIYFNVSHTGPSVPNKATMTLEAYDEDSGRVFATLPVQLQQPADLPEEPVRFERSQLDQWLPAGSAFPHYDPRWWPRPIRYTFLELDELPLMIQRNGPDLLVQWDGKAVAAISDHTRPTILNENAMSFELFEFDEWHVALRIWFFWLDVNIGDGFFIGRHEVPDAERFDLLIRKKDGVVTLACTDLHWREVWGQVVGGPLKATLGMSRETKLKLAKEKLDELWSVWEEEEEQHHNGLYNPTEDYIPRMARRFGQMIVVKKKGTEAHLPMLHNVTQTDPLRWTSSDVRLG